MPVEQRCGRLLAPAVNRRTVIAGRRRWPMMSMSFQGTETPFVAFDTDGRRGGARQAANQRWARAARAPCHRSGTLLCKLAAGFGCWVLKLGIHRARNGATVAQLSE